MIFLFIFPSCVNSLLHILQTNLLPSWMLLICFTSDSSWLKLFWHLLHSYLILFWSWTIWCDFRLPFVVKFLLHYWHLYSSKLNPSWTFDMWSSMARLAENVLKHRSQEIFTPSWTILLWDTRLNLSEKILSHMSQGVSLLLPSWTLAIWFFKVCSSENCFPQVMHECLIFLCRLVMWFF